MIKEVPAINDDGELQLPDWEVRLAGLQANGLVDNALSVALEQLIADNQVLKNEIKYRLSAEQKLQNDLELVLQTLESERQLTSIKTRFITLASHEFRTPLSTILSSVALASRYSQDGNIEKRDHHFEKIRSMVNHLTAILHDFMTATQLDENRIRLRVESFNFCVLVLESIESVKYLGRSDLNIQFDAPAKGILVHGDKAMLLEIIQNLLSNAAHYSKNSVFCSASVHKGHVQFIVRDNGIGIPEKEKKHIFERFFRASNAANHSGIGLGLHISKKCIDLLGGTINFESIEGKSTIFTVKFPQHIPDHA